jgi:gliding motility-associated-like protein
MRTFRQALISFLLILLSQFSYAQNFTPITVTGYNQDCIAESGPSSLATTTKELDDPIASNKVMYSDAFRVFAGLTGGGLPDNGSIVNGNMTFQLANYNSINALFVYRGETKDFNIASPSSYSKIRILAFSTEANVSSTSLLNASLSFTDGTTVPYLTNYNLVDWFNGTANTVITGFGRCARVASAPWGQDGLPSNPRMYYIEIVLSCTDAQKQLQKITFANVTTAGTNAPFPLQVYMAVSGVAYSINVVPASTPSDCNGPNGTASVTVTGNSAPYTYSWNTNPVQTTATITGLMPGTYICTITDANGCITTQSVTVTLNNNQVMQAIANPATICPGTHSFLTYTVITGGPIGSAVWTPGNFPGSVNVWPTSTTTYTVSVIASMGCTATAQVTVTVSAGPPLPIVNGTTICSGTSATLNVTNPQSGYTYYWYNAATGGPSLSTGISYTTPVLNITTTYYVEAVTASGCVSTSRTPVTVTVNPLPASLPVNGLTICPGTSATLSAPSPQTGYTYNWYDAATGGNLLSTGISYTLNSVAAQTTVYLQSTSGSGCVGSSRSPVTVDIYTQLNTPVVTVSNVTTNSVTFTWNAIATATGYEVSTNNGASFQVPSSGTTGTTHTISGLQPLQSVSIIVRALGTPACRNSEPSAIIPATALGTNQVFVPNVFTPNGDGRNDVLYVYGNYITSMKFQVFNQWGELIFQSTDKNIGWNGSYKNRFQPVGVYAYTLVVVLNDGTTVKKQGSINLVR